MYIFLRQRQLDYSFESFENWFLSQYPLYKHENLGNDKYDLSYLKKGDTFFYCYFRMQISWNERDKHTNGN